MSLTQKARVEVLRCRMAIVSGSPVEFWIKRLEEAASHREDAAAILRAEAEELRAIAARSVTNG